MADARHAPSLGLVSQKGPTMFPGSRPAPVGESARPVPSAGRTSRASEERRGKWNQQRLWWPIAVGGGSMAKDDKPSSNPPKPNTAEAFPGQPFLCIQLGER